MVAYLRSSIGGIALDHSFLDHVDAQKGRWHDAVAEAKGISASALLAR
jgi:hypothetical protein